MINLNTMDSAKGLIKNSSILFSFDHFWPLYLIFSLFVILLIMLDMRLSLKSHDESFKKALTWSGIWIGVGLAVGAAIFGYTFFTFQNAATAKRLTLEYFTGYTIEKALAVDNIFIFILIFKSLSIPHELQRRVLFYGIIGALIFRACFIALGAYWFQELWVMIVFGAFLMLSGIKMFFSCIKELHKPKVAVTPAVVRWLSTYLPFTSDLKTEHFFVKKGSQWLITPLFVALLAIEASDVLFALDSVPAIFAITQEPLIVFTSNISAILGLRAIYFLLAGIMHRFKLLSLGLSGILIFIGLKMMWLNPWYEGHFPISYSLSIIFFLLLSSLLASWIYSSGEKSSP